MGLLDQHIYHVVCLSQIWQMEQCKKQVNLKNKNAK
jgi:hypothetical protein